MPTNTTLARAGPIDAALAALESKNLDGFLALLTDDVELIDPHYPAPCMSGKAAVADGMRWLFGLMKSLRFEITDRFVAADGRRVALELTARHVAPGDRRLAVPQVFIIDLEGGRLSRIRAYQPYGPGGAIGVMLSITRSGRRLRRLAEAMRRGAAAGSGSPAQS